MTDTQRCVFFGAPLYCRSAATVFRDPLALSIYDNEHNEDEDRWITIGISNTGRLLVVCHTFKKNDESSVSIRLFSSRKAGKQEIRQYED
jgi:uncharacterized DUF497 family protein